MTINDKVTAKQNRPIKVLQFGEGNFLRAFVDYMIDIANEKGVFDGSIAIAKPISFGSLELFDKQDNLYTVLLRGKENGKVVNDSRIITSVAKTVDCKDDYEEFMALAELDTLRFVVSNTTEAGITLDKMQFHRYKQVYNIFVNDLPQPDIIIYLNSNTDVLMKRIAMRDRSFERQMDRSYIHGLSMEYKYYFNPLSIKHNFMGKEPIIIEIDNSNLDFLNKEEDRKFIINKVEEAISTLGGNTTCSN
jgi:cytidylate kinase